MPITPSPAGAVVLMIVTMMIAMTDDSERGNGVKDNGMTNNKMSSGKIIMVMMNLYDLAEKWSSLKMLQCF